MSAIKVKIHKITERRVELAETHSNLMAQAQEIQQQLRAIQQEDAKLAGQLEVLQELDADETP